MACQVRSFRSFGRGTMNVGHRLQFGVSAFQHTLFDHPDRIEDDPAFYALSSCRDAMAMHEIPDIS